MKRMVSNLVFLLRDVKRDEVLKGVSNFFKGEFGSLLPMTFEEKVSPVLFAAAVVINDSSAAVQIGR